MLALTLAACATLSPPPDPRAVEFPPMAEEGLSLFASLEERNVGTQIAFGSMFALISLIILLSAISFRLSSVFTSLK